jgi:putative intracellular protease/amidase
VTTGHESKILVVLTNHDKLGASGLATGCWLSELTHFLEVIAGTGLKTDFMSPEGGEPPLDPSSLNFKDPVNSKWWHDGVFREKMAHTLTPEAIRPEQYAAIYYPGGHGPMWDLSKDLRVAAIARTIYERGGIVAAVCHGPAGLLPIRLSDNQPLLQGRTVTGFSNLEERLVRKAKYMPFLLENELRKQAGRYTRSFLPGMAHVEVDGRLITGQNPKSAGPVGLALIELLNSRGIIPG